MRPWSYSRKECYETCPRQFKYRYVDKLKSSKPPNKAADRGTAIHLKAEDYLNGVIPIYPPELQKVASHAMLLKSKGAKAEGQLCVDQDWNVLEDWDDPKGYYRSLVDVTYAEGDAVHVEDWKTGKIYADKHAKQMDEYVAITAAKYPDAERFITRLIYIDQGIVTTPKVTQKIHVKPIRIFLDAAISNAEADTTFEMKPGEPKCDWCGYSKRHGGPCQN